MYCTSVPGRKAERGSQCRRPGTKSLTFNISNVQYISMSAFWTKHLESVDVRKLVGRLILLATQKSMLVSWLKWYTFVSLFYVL